MWGTKARALRALAIAFAIVLCLAVTPASGGTKPPVVADIGLTGHSLRIPGGFFGLSVEDSEVTKFEDAGVLFDRMIKIVRPQDNAPMTLRLGGRSADEVYWGVPARVKAPHYVIRLQQAWLDQLATLARHDHLHLEFDLNMAVHSPRMAAAYAKAALKTVGTSHLSGFGMGNEPDLYRLESWLEKERIPSTLKSTPRQWTAGYTPEKYVKEYLAYRHAVVRAAPNKPFAAPELTYPSNLWPTELLALGRRAPQSISFHRYATATCKKVNLHAPGPYAFLRDRYAGGLAHTLSGVASLTAQNHVPLRVTEMNSVTCGGRSKLAESYATALWAPDALFEMMNIGVAGINWHIRPKYANAPFQIKPNGVQAMPESYGLAVFAQMLGPRSRLEETSVNSSLGNYLKAWAVRSRNGLKLLVINKSGRLAKTHINIGSTSNKAVISRLTAPSAGARSGVTFAGQSIGHDGRWSGRLRQTTIRATGSTYDVHVPAYSAALIDFG